jgi:diguanylate cyclase (GGDEF)-like protein
MTTSPATSTTTSSPRRTFSGFGRRIDVFILVIAALATISATIVASLEFAHGFMVRDRVLFAIVSVLLVVTEVKSTSLLNGSDDGVVTPSWAFTFTLLLLGSPTGAIVMMVFAMSLADALTGKPFSKILFNVSQISLSLSLGAFVLFACGVRGPLFNAVELPSDRAIAMIMSGIVVFSSNGVIICRLLAWLEGAKFWDMMRGTFLLSLTSDAAMLAIAPIFLITAKNNLLMLPLMGTATFFVYQTAQNALRRTHEANHDPLTQLLNRRAFNAKIDDFTSSNPGTLSSASLLLLDLDRFKEVNDRLGHRTGDHVLQQFSSRLAQALPPDSVIARLGGDEFAVLLTGVTSSEAEEIARSVHEQLAEPLLVDGFPIIAGSSIGVSHAPIHGHTPSDLLHAADVAMYRAKRHRSGVEVYHAFGSTQERGRVTLLSDVDDGLANDEFILEYQPQVNVETGELVSVEALLRWMHPVHGRIPPNEFIVLAEHTDLIDSITHFVVQRAIADIGPLGDHIAVAVNVSARNLENRHFASSLLADLGAAGFDPTRLEVEITESALASDPERISVSLEQLRSAGVRISIDDFGTGYSSFGTLRDSTIDRIKIDRSFITHADRTAADTQIVKALIELAHGLGFDVVAEGVETVEVWNLLAAFGCDLAQGFLLSPAVPLDRLHDLINQSFTPDPFVIDRFSCADEPMSRETVAVA